MNEYLHQLYNDLINTSSEFGLSDASAGDFANAMIEKIQHDHAGNIYIPKPKEARKKRALKMFNGVNIDAVCTEFGISKATLYRWYKESQTAGNPPSAV